MERWVGKIAIVTGSSAGIGLATSIALVREGMRVIGLARRKDLMEESVLAATRGAKGQFYGYECDVSNEQNVVDIFDKIKNKFGTVHVLVNNAGVLGVGTILETSSDLWKKVFDINVMGVLYCTQQALKLMKASGEEGHVVLINSVQGHRVHIFGETQLNVYPASKHAITGITESLQKENLNGKIRFTSISPGYVKTTIMDDPERPGNMNATPYLEAEDVADSILYVIGTPLRVQITELTIRPLGEKTS